MPPKTLLGPSGPNPTTNQKAMGFISIVHNSSSSESDCRLDGDKGHGEMKEDVQHESLRCH